MKIVQINGSYGMADSTGRTTKEMHEWLMSKGHQSSVFVASINDNSSADENVCLFSSHLDQTMHAILSRATGLQGYFSFFSTKKLIERLKLIQPDVIILRVLHNNSIHFPSLMEYIKTNKIATVLVLHDCWYYTGHCCYYTQEQCEKWKATCHHCPAIKKWNTSWFFDTSKKCQKDKQTWFSEIKKLGVVGVSDWITQEARHSILKTAKKLGRIYNWINQDIFKPMDTTQVRETLQISKDKAVLLGVSSSWSNEKGLPEMLMTAQAYPDAQMILIGNTPQDIPWPSNIKRVGTVKDITKLAQYYSMADIFLNPSIQETFGKTTAEALSCGTPVVAYKTTACTELVGSDRGALVDLRNQAEFVSKVKEVLTQEKQSYTLACRKFSETYFEKDKNLNAYLALFEELVQERAL